MKVIAKAINKGWLLLSFFGDRKSSFPVLEQIKHFNTVQGFLKAANPGNLQWMTVYWWEPQQLE